MDIVKDVAITYQINNEEVYDWIRRIYMQVYHEALIAGLPLDNIQIRMRSGLKKSLGIEGALFVGYDGAGKHNVPVVADDTIKEIKTPEGFRSDILIYDPDWLEEDTGA